MHARYHARLPRGSAAQSPQPRDGFANRWRPIAIGTRSMRGHEAYVMPRSQPSSPSVPPIDERADTTAGTMSAETASELLERRSHMMNKNENPTDATRGSSLRVRVEAR